MWSACRMTMGEPVPKYSYTCTRCDREWSQWNSMDDPDVECPYCFSRKVKKNPSLFSSVKNKETSKKGSKENVIEHIEENRQILKDMKKNLSKEEL